MLGILFGSCSTSISEIFLPLFIAWLAHSASTNHKSIWMSLSFGCFLLKGVGLVLLSLFDWRPIAVWRPNRVLVLHNRALHCMYKSITKVTVGKSISNYFRYASYTGIFKEIVKLYTYMFFISSIQSSLSWVMREYRFVQLMAVFLLQYNYL